MSYLLEDNIVVSLTDTELKRELLKELPKVDNKGCNLGCNCTCARCLYAFCAEIDMINKNMNSVDKKYAGLIAYGYIYRSFFYNESFSLKRAVSSTTSIGPNLCMECRNFDYKIDSEWGFGEYCDVCILFE